MSEQGKTHKDDYKKRQRMKTQDRWVKKNPPGPLGPLGLNRKGRRELVKRIRRGR